MNATKLAIVGLAGRFPGAGNAEAFWENLQAGVDSLKPGPDEPPVTRPQPGADGGHWVRANCLLPDAEDFDAGFFGLSPSEALLLDPQQRLFLECSWEALEDAGLLGRREDELSIGVYAGANFSTYFTPNVHDDMHLLQAFPTMLGNDKDYLATRVAFKLGLRGPAITVQTACSTSLVAAHLACQALLAGECDAAIAGGVSVSVPRNAEHYYLPGGMLAPAPACRAFDADAAGTVFSEGVGAVVLMRLDDALAAGHQIYAVVLGGALNNDGSDKGGYTAPSKAGQIAVLRQAYAAAGVSPATVGHLEAHGTGTIIGDAIELGALTEVFREATGRVGFCSLGSVKTNVGHLAAAAGAAGLIKAALALKHRFIPASLNYERPNPDFRPEASPFYVRTAGGAWPRMDGPRRAGVSAFGVGGTNAHLVLEEHIPEPAQASGRPWRLLPISARSKPALEAVRQRLEDHAGRDDAAALEDIAYTLSVGRRSLEHRSAIFCRDTAGLPAALAEAAADVARAGKASQAARVAFMFPGQGAQSLGMGRRLHASEPLFRDAVEQGLSLVPTALASELRALLYDWDGLGDAACARRRLQDTEIAQPALFLTEYALARQLMAWGVRPAAMIGHSVGEYAAACISGVLPLDDALRLVVERGRLMQTMAPGAMLSVGLPAEQLAALLPAEVDVAGFNGPAQTVVSGDFAAIDALAARLEASGAMVRRLDTSHAFHSRMMAPMLPALEAAAARLRIHPPAIPYVSNLTADFATPELVAAPAYWSRHVREAVRFSDGVSRLAESGVDLFVEVGPGRALTGLARQTLGAAANASVVTLLGASDLDEDEQLARGLGRLWSQGADVDWAALYDGEARRRVSLPTYPFERRRYSLPRDKDARRGNTDTRRKLPLADWFYAPSWLRLPSPAPGPAPEGVTRVVFLDGDDAALDEALTEGPNVVVVARGAAYERKSAQAYVVSGAFEDYGRLAEDLASDGVGVVQVVHAWLAGPLSGDDADLADRIETAKEVGIFSLLQILDGLVKAGLGGGLQIDVVTRGLFEVTGGEPLRPETASAAAFVRVAPQEHLGLRCRLVDLGPQGASLAPLPGLLSGADETAGEQVYALRNGFVWRERFERLRALPGGSPRLREGGCYLITGGLGAIGLALADHLVKTYGARVALLSRTPLPPEVDRPSLLQDPATPAALRDRLRALAELSGNVVVLSGDVENEGDMGRVREAVLSEFGRLDGVICGAGHMELSGTTLSERVREEYRKHFGSKAYGVATVKTVFDDLPLDFVLVLSSISTVLGGLGHCAYSAANHVADALASSYARKRPGVWRTSNWDLWRFPSDGAAPASGIFETALTPDEGRQAFERLLNGLDQPQTIISTRDLQERLEEWAQVSNADPAASHDAEAIYARPDLDTPFEEPREGLETQIAEVWRGALGLEAIGRHDDFYDIGGHSLLMMQITARLQARLGVTLSSEAMLKASTVEAMARLLADLALEPAA